MMKRSLHPTSRPRAGFTLVEMLISLAVLLLFFWGAYQLFSGGTAVAGKAQWLQARTSELNNAFQILNQRLKSTSFPSTLLNDAIHDAATGPRRREYYVTLRNIVPPDGTREDVSAKATEVYSDLLLGSWIVCEPERIDAQGKVKPGSHITDRLFLVPNGQEGRVKTATLVLRSEAYSFTTSSSQGYAQNGQLALSRTKERDTQNVLVSDVTSVRFETVAGDKPLPIRIRIETKWTKDPKAEKVMENAIIPNAVGIKTQ